MSNVILHGSAPGRDADIRVPEPDINAPLEERAIGGLGMFLVRKMMDEVHDKHAQGRNRLAFRKRWH